LLYLHKINSAQRYSRQHLYCMIQNFSLCDFNHDPDLFCYLEFL
jgi:hypothetical protein